MKWSRFQPIWIVLKTEVGKLDVGKLKTVAQDLKQLSIVVDTNV